MFHYYYNFIKVREIEKERNSVFLLFFLFDFSLIKLASRLVKQRDIRYGVEMTHSSKARKYNGYQAYLKKIYATIINTCKCIIILNFLCDIRIIMYVLLCICICVSICVCIRYYLYLVVDCIFIWVYFYVKNTF